MNKQDKGNGKRGIEWTDYTWNVIGGCKHACRWTMPDGSTAICYAEEVATKLRSDTFYPQGFEHHYWQPERLNEPLKLKQPARIFLDSMSDLMGHWVPDDQINAVLDICRRAPQHTFQLLTKNAPRLIKFDFPANVWVGVSAPPSEYMGKPLSAEQQSRFVTSALNILASVNAAVRWMSIEPLSFDIAAVFEAYRNGKTRIYPLPLEWAVIGAASNGPKLYQPKTAWVRDLHYTLDTNRVPVFHKGNLDWTPHREDFPQTVATPAQLGMFESGAE